MIRVEGVSHRYGKLEVLTNVWFHVPAGEVFGFIGPNGAGKTTTLRMISTLLEPLQGRILVGGVDVLANPMEVRRRLGFMPDDAGTYEMTTVSEYLEFFASAYGLGLGGRHKTIDAVMELTDLGPLRDRMVSGLSKGMRQRLAIARTLLHDPDVLVLDEPANGLDPRARMEMRDLVLHLRELGKTILLSSHILTELSDMVTSVAILEAGKVVASGPIGDLSRNLRPERRVRLRFLTLPDDPEALFDAIDEVAHAQVHGENELRVTYVGGDEVVAAIVARAAAAGLGIVRVEPERDDLEHIFLQVTEGKLQ